MPPDAAVAEMSNLIGKPNAGMDNHITYVRDWIYDCT